MFFLFVFFCCFYCFKLLTKQKKKGKPKQKLKPKHTKTQNQTKKTHQKLKQPPPSKIPNHSYNLIFKSRRWKSNHLATSLSIQCISLQQKREKCVPWKQLPPAAYFLCHQVCSLLCHSCHHLLTRCGTGISVFQSPEVTRSLNFWFLFFLTVPACSCLFTCHFCEELFKFN